MISKKRIKKTHSLSNSEAHAVQNAVHQNRLAAFNHLARPISAFVQSCLPNHTSSRKKEVRSAIMLELGTGTF